jgi:hypothetical protein
VLESAGRGIRRGGTFHLRYTIDGKRIWKNVGKDARLAHDQKEDLEWKLNNTDTVSSLRQIITGKPDIPFFQRMSLPISGSKAGRYAPSMGNSSRPCLRLAGGLKTGVEQACCWQREENLWGANRGAKSPE